MSVTNAVQKAIARTMGELNNLELALDVIGKLEQAGLTEEWVYDNMVGLHTMLKYLGK